MLEPELLLLFVRPLNRAGIRYVITGSVAAMFYGEPRLTHNIDTVISLNTENLHLLAEVFPADDFYVPPAEMIFQEMRRLEGGQFNVIHIQTGFKADFYTVGADELNLWAIQNARPKQFGTVELMLAPAEYIIVRKLEYYREGGSQKHLQDIRSMLAISSDQIDLAMVEAWITERKLESEWKRASA